MAKNKPESALFNPTVKHNILLSTKHTFMEIPVQVPYLHVLVLFVFLSLKHFCFIEFYSMPLPFIFICIVSFLQRAVHVFFTYLLESFDIHAGVSLL
ncbi:hypothetical protein BDF14DRAFT_1826414 [Spinellus fusiger]|nr:hypothetical protein BDF14DRAFT_1826414 [Spinellus fusiger]